MILLLGGTSDTGPIAERLATAGYRVLASKATGVSLSVGDHPNIECRTGPLDETSLVDLIDRRAIVAIVDATHPYAAAIREMAWQVAQQKGIAYASFMRPAVIDPATPGVTWAADHAAAARAAFAQRRPVLLTTGARNLAPYARQARETGAALVVRVLDRPESWDACRREGILPKNVLAGRGPFSVEENRQHIRAFGIGVLVTKDSGTAGGTLEKLQAAEAERCHVVVVRRPMLTTGENFADIDAIVRFLAGACEH